MKEQLIDELESRQQSPPKRPLLLTVLCILTWIGCLHNLASYYLFFSLWHFVSQLGFDEIAIHPWIFWKAVIGTVATLMSLFGSIVLFMRRKWGFYSYVPGQLIPLLAGAYCPSFLFGPAQTISTEYVLATIIVSITFIFLYRKSFQPMGRPVRPITIREDNPGN